MAVKLWIDDMISRYLIVKKECEARGVDARTTEIMIDRVIEPYGLWKGSDNKEPPVDPQEAKNKLEAIKRKYKLFESGGFLKRNNAKDGFLSDKEFQECSNNLKPFGYIYDKTNHCFKKGVKA